MKVILLIGEMGSGKSYLGRYMAEKMGYCFIEGDSHASPEMKAAIDGFKIITKEMVDDLVVEMVEEVWACAESGAKGVVVSQALYMESHRQTFLRAIDRFEVDMYWVKTPLIQHIRQLYSRPRGLRWILYWLMSKPFFQRPKGFYLVMRNKR